MVSLLHHKICVSCRLEEIVRVVVSAWRAGVLPPLSLRAALEQVRVTQAPFCLPVPLDFSLVSMPHVSRSELAALKAVAVMGGEVSELLRWACVVPLGFRDGLEVGCGGFTSSGEYDTLSCIRASSQHRCAHGREFEEALRPC